MLQVWDKLTPEQALELLDYVYPDARVRSLIILLQFYLLNLI